MTIGRIFKYFVLIFIVVFCLIVLDRLIFMMLGNEPHEPEFTVQGNRPVLNRMIINIESINANGSLYTCSKVQTLLFKGQKFIFKNSDVWFYKIYFSYGNQVGVLIFENLYRASGGWERVNSIYITKKHNDLFVEYYPVVSDDRKGRKITKLVMGTDEYFTENNILEEEQKKYFEKFFGFYEPDKQQYKRDPLDKKFIQKFEQESLEQKLFYDIDIVDIEKMNIPDIEKKVLIEKAKKEQDPRPCNT